MTEVAEGDVLAHTGARTSCVIDAPSSWLSLVGLRPRRAQRRFTSQL